MADFHTTYKNSVPLGDSDDHFHLDWSYLPSGKRSKQITQAQTTARWSLPWSCPGNNVARLLSTGWYNSAITPLRKHSRSAPLVLRCPVRLLAAMVADSCFCRHCPVLDSVYTHVVFWFGATLSGQDFMEEISAGHHPTFTLSSLFFV